MCVNFFLFELPRSCNTKCEERTRERERERLKCIEVVITEYVMLQAHIAESERMNAERFHFLYFTKKKCTRSLKATIETQRDGSADYAH